MKKDTLEISGSDWYDLNEFQESCDLGLSPSDFWLLLNFTIVLRHRHKHYLVLEYPSYPLCAWKAKEIRECIWSTPYSAFKVQTGPYKYTVVSHIKELFAKFLEEKKETIGKRIEYKLYHMGISGHTQKVLNDVLELKRSPREPDKWKCFFVKRYVISELDNLGKYNVVDPECLKAYRYLCLEDADVAVDVPDTSRPYLRLFRGKPLSTNVGYFFLKNEVNILKDGTTEIENLDFYYNESGLLLSFDLMSFGKFHKTVKKEFKTLVKTGSEIAQGFIIQLDSIFRRHLDANGFYQVRLEGDGFVACSPTRHHVYGGSGKNGVDIQVEKTLKLIKTILRVINEAIVTSNVIFGCRCALIYDKYVYGKIGGFYSDKADFAGESLITVTRMQSGLGDWQKKKGIEGGACYICVTPKFHNEYRAIFDKCDFKYEETVELKQKESVLEVAILSCKVKE